MENSSIRVQLMTMFQNVEGGESDQYSLHYAIGKASPESQGIEQCVMHALTVVLWIG